MKKLVFYNLSSLGNLKDFELVSLFPMQGPVKPGSHSLSWPWKSLKM